MVRNKGKYGLKIIVSCIVAALLITFIVVIALVIRRKQQKRREYETKHLAKTIQSAPNSRASSPTLGVKRLSCPNLHHSPTKQQFMMRSITVDGVPSFTLPPERIQPSFNGDRYGPRTSLQCQQSLIGSLKPDLYSSLSDDDDNFPLSMHGRLWYSVVYDAAVEQLNVRLVKVKELPPRSSQRHLRDPFVKVFLLPDEKTCKTSKVAATDIAKRTLKFSVYDVDKRRIRHTLGHIMVKLRDLELNRMETYWADLEPMSQALSALGDVQITMCYLSPNEKVKACVMKATNLKHVGLDRETSVYMKVQLYYGRKLHRTKKTAVRECAMVIEFNESFSFSVAGKQLESCRLEFSLMLISKRIGDVLNQDVEYGRIVIGPFMHARGAQLIQWQTMLAQPRSPITSWHSLSAMS